MAIRFTCPSCSRPIEVDDEWAGQQVGCPYCQRVISAPSGSTLEVGPVPTASSERDEAIAPPPPPPDAAPVPARSLHPPGHRRPWGIFAFIAAAGAMVAMLIWVQLVGEWFVENVGPDVSESQDPHVIQRAGQKLLEKRGNELQRFSLFPTVASIGGVVGVALAIASLVRNDCNKAWPILAIIIGVLALPCSCTGLLMPLLSYAPTT